MAFNDAEISNQDGRAVALYLLVWDQTVWAYTSADREIERTEIINGVSTPITYMPVAISDRGLVQGGSANNDFTVDCPANLPIVALFRGTPPSQSIWLTCRRLHVAETDAPIFWIGNVINVKRGDYASAQIIGQPLSGSFRRTGLRLCWSRECPHFVYDSGCKLDPEDFRTNATITAVTGTTFTVNNDGGKADGYFNGGFVAWEINADGTMERRMIERHVGNVITLLGLTDGLAISTAVALYPGCDRNPVTCDDKFDNIDNYGGFDFMPGETPFGTILF